jgi:hypothetical protein
MNTRVRFACLVAAAFFAGCGDERIGGGGDEMGNFIRVSLRDSAGAPAAGARIMLRPASQILSPDSIAPLPLRTLVVGEDGTVDVELPPPGRYTLVARAGSTGRADTFSVARGTTTLSGRILSLGRLASLTGRIEPRTGLETWISLAGRADAVGIDSLGNFRLDSVVPGPVEVVAHSPAGIISRANLSVSAGETLDLGSLASDWSDWPLKKTIYLNTGAKGIAIGSTVTDLPLALRLTSSDLDFSKLRSDFADLRATRADGRPLPLSVERWDATSGILTVWIGMDTIHTGRDSQAIVLRGGNTAAAATSANPFQSTGGWSGVWHMGQDLSDATNTGNNADDASTTYKSGGVVGECRWFTRTTPGRMSVANAANLDPTPSGDLLVEAWVRLDTKSANGSDPIVSRGNSGYSLQREGTTNFIAFAVLDSSSASDTTTVKVVGNTDFADGQFHHVAGMRRGNSLLVFVDGIRDGQKLYTGATKKSNSALDIGSNGSNDHWEGMIDELRIGRVSRSDDWIRLSYEGQKQSSGFVSR